MSPFWYLTIYLVGGLVAVFCLAYADPKLFEAEAGEPHPYRHSRWYMLGAMLSSWLGVLAFLGLCIWHVFDVWKERRQYN